MLQSDDMYIYVPESFKNKTACVTLRVSKLSQMLSSNVVNVVNVGVLNDDDSSSLQYVRNENGRVIGKVISDGVYTTLHN